MRRNVLLEVARRKMVDGLTVEKAQDILDHFQRRIEAAMKGQPFEGQGESITATEAVRTFRRSLAESDSRAVLPSSWL